MENMYERTVEDSKVVIAHAKLTENELHPITQAIYLGTSMKCLKLMEIPASVLNEFKQGNRVLFRGDVEDSPVLCTQKQTFQVKEAETSNSLNLIPGLLFPDDPRITNEDENERQLRRQNIEGIYYSYLELKVCKPRFKKLVAILEESAYVDHIIENKSESDTRKLYTMSDLLDVIQGSEGELKEELKRRNASLLGGYIRILEYNYSFRMLSHIIQLANSNSWSLDEVDKEETKRTLESLVPEEIVDFLFEHYTVPSEKTKPNGDPYYRLIEDKVCRAAGEALMRSKECYVLTEFLSVWKLLLPEGVTPDLKQLEGIMYQDKLHNPVRLIYLPQDRLSEDIKTRMDQLFKVKEKWTLEDIRPYIECLACDKLNVNALLTKYARASNENGERYYSSRLGR